MTEINDILTERGKRYGRFIDHAAVTIRLKSVLRDAVNEHRKDLDYDQEEALDMICHKLGRIVNGDPNYEDSWRDVAGYATLVADRLKGIVR